MKITRYIDKDTLKESKAKRNEVIWMPFLYSKKEFLTYADIDKWYKVEMIITKVKGGKA